MATIWQLLDEATARFKKNGLENPQSDAQWLLASLLNSSRLDLFLRHNESVDEEIYRQFLHLTEKRADRIPLQQLIGTVNFGNLTITVTEDVLIPRPETEELVEKIIAKISVPPASILDLGTGSGAIALSLAQAFPGANIHAIDRSQKALHVAKKNAKRNEISNVKFFHSCWFDSAPQVFYELIVSNPPYLTESEWQESQPEVRLHEPKEALVADNNGLADLFLILEQAPQFLANGGWIALEMGIHHGSALKKFASNMGYQKIQTERDILNRERFFFARWSTSSSGSY